MNNTPLPPALANFDLAANEPVPLHYYIKKINTETLIESSALYTGLTGIAVGVFMAQIASIGLMLIPGTQPLGAMIAIGAFSTPALLIEGAAAAASAAAVGQRVWRDQVGPDQTGTRIKFRDGADLVLALTCATAAAKGMAALKLTGDAVDVARIMRRVRHFFWGIEQALTRPKLIGIAAWQMTKLHQLLEFLNVPALYAVSYRERAIIMQAKRGLELIEKLRRGITPDGVISEEEESTLADEVMNRALRALISSTGVVRSLSTDFMGGILMPGPIIAPPPQMPGIYKTLPPIVVKGRPIDDEDGALAAKYAELDEVLLDALKLDVAAAYRDFEQMDALFGTTFFDAEAHRQLDIRSQTLSDFVDTLSSLQRSAQHGEPNYDVAHTPFSGDVSEGLKDLYDERTPWSSDRDMFSKTQKTVTDAQSLWRPHPLSDFTRGLSIRIELLIAMGVVSPLVLRAIQFAPANSDFANPDPLAFIQALTRSDNQSLFRLNAFTPPSALWAVEGGLAVLKASGHTGWTSGAAKPLYETARQEFVSEILDNVQGEDVWPTFMAVISDPSNFIEKVLAVTAAQKIVATAAAKAFTSLEKRVSELKPASADVEAWLQALKPVDSQFGVFAYQGGSLFISDEIAAMFHESFNLPLHARFALNHGIPERRIIDQFFRDGRWNNSPHSKPYRILDGDAPAMDPATALAKSGALVGSASLTTVTSMSSYCKVPRFTIDARGSVKIDPDLQAQRLVNIPGLRRSERGVQPSGKPYLTPVWDGGAVRLKNAIEVVASSVPYAVELDPDTMNQDFSLDQSTRVWRVPLSALLLANAFASARVALPYRRQDIRPNQTPEEAQLQHLLFRHLFEEDSAKQTVDAITRGYKFLASTSVYHNRRSGQIAINFPARGVLTPGSGVVTIPSALLFNQSLLSEAASLDALTAMARSHDPETMGSIRSAAREWKPGK